MTTFIQELIDIPEQVQRGDFVLRLSEGVNRPDETLRDYVVTPELQACFDNALSFISSAVHSRTSKATYLHGSFGSGKSHFMAVLHLILQGNPAARGIPELAPVISKHNAWMRRQEVPAGAVPHDRRARHGVGHPGRLCRLHPPHPPAGADPGVYLAEGLFQDAQRLRERMGDDAVLRHAERGHGRRRGLGRPGSRLGRRRASRPPWRSRLARKNARSSSAPCSGRSSARTTRKSIARAKRYLSLDKGLSVISKHAASLGYDALILFLDELILWLASHAADLKFVHQEGQKLAKLVEAQTPDRPVPIVSFVARQRDLRELIGDAVPGAERLNFSDALKHWEGRFHTITLEDRNLPAIAEKRVLKCKSAAARAGAGRRLRADGEDPRGGDEHAADQRGRPGDVPQGLPVQPGAGADADRRLQRAAARADGPQGDAAAAGRAARHAEGRRHSCRSATCST